MMHSLVGFLHGAYHGTLHTSDESETSIGFVPASFGKINRRPIAPTAIAPIHFFATASHWETRLGT